MGRYTFPAFNQARAPRHVVLWDLHWHVLDCPRPEPGADLAGAMAVAIERLEGEGWRPGVASSAASFSSGARLSDAC
jgi:hypothetical protein